MSRRSRMILGTLVAGVLSLLAARVFLASDRSLSEVFADLGHAERAVRAQAAGELTGAWQRLLVAPLGELESTGLPFLEQTLLRGEGDARHYAATGLYLLAGGHAQAETIQAKILPTLLRAADDQDTRVRQQIALTLAIYRPRPPAEARGALLGLLRDPDEKTRRAAVQGLSRVRPVTGEMRAALVATLTSGEGPALRAQAAAGLAELGVVDPEVVAALLAALDSPDTSLRGQAISALGRLAPPDAAVVQALEGVRQTDNNETIRETAAAALRSLRRGQGVPQGLWSQLDSPEVETRRRAAVELTLYQLDDLRGALPALRPLLDDPDASVRRHVAAAIYQAAYVNEANRVALGEVADTLIELTGDDDPEVRWSALRGLALIQPAPPSGALEPALRLLEDEVAKVREMAAVIVGRVRPVQAATVEKLFDSLRRQPELESEVAQALARLAVADAGVEPVLIERLGDTSNVVRSAAIFALGRTRSAAAASHLQEIIENEAEDRLIRARAEAALMEITRDG